jgi:A/G-specific adenine glycosylase
MASVERILKELKQMEIRDFPWRRTKNPYKILVSEIMLQQTQAGRVVLFYKAFMREFPTAKKLAEAPLSKVLKCWSGLGYNRRAMFLHKAAKVIVKNGFPKEASGLEQLPGVGHYTARATMTFAFNKREVFIETNIRTVIFFHQFNQVPALALSRPGLGKMPDAELLPVVEELLEKSEMEPREFYYRMMDYGASLKRIGVRLNRMSKHYTKQSKFEGSYRQLRGALLRALIHKPATLDEIITITERKRSDVIRVLTTLSEEGMIAPRNHKFSLAK